MTVAKHPSAEGTVSYKCSTDLSAKQFMAVVYSAADTVAICASAVGTLFAGILMNKPDGTYITTAEVAQTPGHTVPAYAGAAITTVGAPISTDTSGYLIMAADDNDNVVGHAMTTAGAAGDIFALKLCTPYFETNVSVYTTGS